MSREIQEDLARLGYYKGAIDGSMGAQSKNAVLRFQKDNGLKADGLAGAITQGKLLEKCYGLKSEWLDGQTLKIFLPKPQLDVLSNTLATVPNTYKSLKAKPVLLFNGGLFHKKNSMVDIIDEYVLRDGVLSKYMLTQDGIVGLYDLKRTGKFPKEGIGGGPSLVLNGKIMIDSVGLTPSFLNTKHPRFGIGYSKEGMTLVVVHGRRKGQVGCTILQLADIMMRCGCEDAIALDGGGSIYVLNRYGKLLNQPNETRVVNHCLALYK